MRIDVYVPIVLSLLLPAVAPQVGRRVSPALAARVLTVAGVLTAAASTWALFLLSATLINRAPSVAAEASEQGRALPEPVPETIAVVAVAALGVIAFRLFHAVRAHYATRRVLLRLCEGHPPDSELIVAASSTPHAFAIPGTPGRILVTAAMLGALEPAERRVLLAHERAHLTHRHSALSTAVILAAAANPLLVPVRTTVTFLLERWADEVAAGSVGDRRTTARALARAALISQRARTGCALHFSEHAVTRRIAALQTAPPPDLWPIGAAVLALGALPALGAVDATGDLLRLLAETLPDW
ncbi:MULTISPECIES: M48 family metalloprotease [unclassified Streptomyces]|uniref:M48 family metalloprotease n=1 Tax=unclassified Streptomyces TaxID=2593676 RepID=UPI002E7FC446|nr:M48 family metalloprotease [Streptomyces sp. NBC_00589]WTI34938.1 M48 family metalloprotease [Streptomyces sp. NBC_00775]WUB31388.1 M48 family metalloprotease [Streptomyces sp. NBC_00589]